MAKFFGKVGYVLANDISDGVWTEQIISRNYYGDVLRDQRRLDPTENLNDDIRLNNYFSIVADAFAYQNFHAIRFVEWMGTFWKVTTVEVQRPRLLLNIGGVYNGLTEGSA